MESLVDRPALPEIGSRRFRRRARAPLDRRQTARTTRRGQPSQLQLFRRYYNHSSN